MVLTTKQKVKNTLYMSMYELKFLTSIVFFIDMHPCPISIPTIIPPIHYSIDLTEVLGPSPSKVYLLGIKFPKYSKK